MRSTNMLAWVVAALLASAALLACASRIGQGRVLSISEREVLRKHIDHARGVIEARMWKAREKDRYYSAPPALTRRQGVLNRLSDLTHGRANGLVREIDASTQNGALYLVTWGEARNTVAFLLVTCPSKGDSHIIFVPTHMDSARQARAWTFGMDEKDFDVETET